MSNLRPATLPKEKRGHGKETTVAGKLALELLERFPSAPTRSLARILQRDNPEVFTTLNQAQLRIGYYRGKTGAKNRSIVSVVVAPPVVAPAFGLPVEITEAWPAYELPIKRGIGIVMSDVHVPYHLSTALAALFRYAKAKPIKFIILDGDISDCFALSRFQKDPRKVDFKNEIQSVTRFLDALEINFPSAKIIYKEGNHERRLSQYLESRAPELLDVAGGWIDFLKLKERGIEWVPEQRLIHAGYLTILHGDEFQRGQSLSVNPARTAFIRTKDCALVAHSHVGSEHTETTVRDRVITCWSIGCLCQLHPEWARLNKWSTGFALLEMDGKNFAVQNKKILPDGTVV